MRSCSFIVHENSYSAYYRIQAIQLPLLKRRALRTFWFPLYLIFLLMDANVTALIAYCRRSVLAYYAGDK